MGKRELAVKNGWQGTNYASRISARVAAIAAPELSRGTASMQPSVIGASASSSVQAMVDIARNYSLSQSAGDLCCLMLQTFYHEREA